MNSILIAKLRPVIDLMIRNDMPSAADAFSSLGIVDTPAHLAQDKELQYLIWDLYELLILSNENFSTKQEIIENFKKIDF